jgi:putative spermidine/putrescine transport system permease protein
MTKGERLAVLLLALWLLFLIVPFVPLVLTSLAKGWPWPRLFPSSFHVRAWAYLLADTVGTWRAATVSLWVALMVTMINLMVSIPAAHALVRYRFPGKRVVEGLLMAPILVPPLVTVMGMHLTFIRLHLTETVTGVVLTHLVPSLPYMIRALVISYSTLHPDLERQAQMLGAGAVQRWRYVVFPHMLPGIVAGSSLSFLVSFSQYVPTLLIGGGQVVTLPLLMFPFLNGGDASVGAAFSLVFAMIALLVLWGMDRLLQRHYDRHMTLHI